MEANAMVRTTETAGESGLEELVDRMMDSLLGCGRERGARSAARSVHDARRLRRAGDLDGALDALSGADPGACGEADARWLRAEWLGLARRRFAGAGMVIYTQGTAGAAALRSRPDGSLEVAAVMGMRWRPGKVVSRRCLRGLRPLAGRGR